MKKLLYVIMALTLAISSVSADKVGVSAVVKQPWQKLLPSMLWVSPSYTPVVIAQNTVQYFSINIRDADFSEADNHTIYYTITPDNGSTSIISGELDTESDIVAWKWQIDFAYLAWSVSGSQNITLTFTDSDDTSDTQIVKTIALYVY